MTHYYETAQDKVDRTKAAIDSEIARLQAASDDLPSDNANWGDVAEATRMLNRLLDI